MITYNIIYSVHYQIGHDLGKFHMFRKKKNVFFSNFCYFQSTKPSYSLEIYLEKYCFSDFEGGFNLKYNCYSKMNPVFTPIWLQPLLLSFYCRCYYDSVKIYV